MNNMPGPAFEETGHQFAKLICSSAPGVAIDLRCYHMSALSHPDAARRRVLAQYQSVEQLYAEPPDALVVSGSEPLAKDLTDEPYWSPLHRLLRWAEATVASTMLSCLAAHAAVLAFDGIARSPLAAKLSGVFPQPVDESHPLGAGLGTVAAFPHSRWNTIPAGVLRSLGYEVVMGSEDGEWTVVARERAGRMLVLVQGHPEYSPTTLLREFRRDVRRFADGSSSAPPEVPSHYLDATGAEILGEFVVSRADRGRRPPPEDFPFEAVAGHIAASWTETSARLFANWVADAARRVTPGAAMVGAGA